MLDILFDEAPPSAPNHLKTIEVGGNSATLTFDHSPEYWCWKEYQIYKMEELTKTYLLQKMQMIFPILILENTRKI